MHARCRGGGCVPTVFQGGLGGNMKGRSCSDGVLERLMNSPRIEDHLQLELTEKVYVSSTGYLKDARGDARRWGEDGQ